VRLAGPVHLIAVRLQQARAAVSEGEPAVVVRVGAVQEGEVVLAAELKFRPGHR